MDKEFDNCNPGDKGHKCMKDALQGVPTKDIATVNMPSSVEGYNLFDLPEQMHRHLPVCFRDVGLP